MVSDGADRRGELIVVGPVRTNERGALNGVAGEATVKRGHIVAIVHGHLDEGAPDEVRTADHQNLHRENPGF